VSKYIMPSRWGMKTIDAIAVLILAAVLIHWLLPTTGLADAIHTGAHLLAQGIAWIAGWIVQFLNWI
jgi:hypothetical protein